MTTKVTRLEIIDKNGKTYQSHNVKNLQIMEQDDGQTLKIFHDGTPGTEFGQEHQNALKRDLKWLPLSKRCQSCGKYSRWNLNNLCHTCYTEELEDYS